MASVDRGETIENTEEDVKESKEDSGSGGDDKKNGDDDQTERSPVPTAPPAELIEDS